MGKNQVVICAAVINQAMNFIFEHLDEEITVDDVARHCCYSRYHLMRMFKEHTDEAIYQFMKRLRLERSAWRLKVEKEKKFRGWKICGVPLQRLPAVHVHGLSGGFLPLAVQDGQSNG